jgi:hypothetical protein
MKRVLFSILLLSLLTTSCTDEPETRSKSTLKVSVPPICNTQNNALTVAKTLGVTATYYCKTKNLRVEDKSRGIRFIQVGDNKPVTSITNGFADISNSELPAVITVYTYDPNPNKVVTTPKTQPKSSN